MGFPGKDQDEPRPYKTWDFEGLEMRKGLRECTVKIASSLFDTLPSSQKKAHSTMGGDSVHTCLKMILGERKM